MDILKIIIAVIITLLVLKYLGRLLMWLGYKLGLWTWGE